MTARSVEAKRRRAISASTKTAIVPAERRASPPPERVVGAEGGHAERDHPLAERRMHDVRRRSSVKMSVSPGVEVGVGARRASRLVADVQERPRVLHVVGLVEDERVRVPEVPEPQHRGEQRDERAGRPSTRARAGAGSTAGPTTTGRGACRAAPPTVACGGVGVERRPGHPRRPAGARRPARRRRPRHSMRPMSRGSVARLPRPGVPAEPRSACHAGPRVRETGRMIILAATPIGNLGDASRAAARRARARRGRRRGGHPRHAATARRRSASRTGRGSSRCTSTTSGRAPPSSSSSRATPTCSC